MGLSQPALSSVPVGWREMRECAKVGGRTRGARGGGEMSGEVLMELAQFACQTVAAAAITDGWESAWSRFARLFGRGNVRRTKVAEGWLAQTRELLAAAGPGGLEQARQAAAERWAGRFADLLDEEPAIEAELRALVDEVAAELPAGAVSAAGYSVAAGRDVRISAAGGSVVAGVIHGNVAAPSDSTVGSRLGDPSRPGRTGG